MEAGAMLMTLPCSHFTASARMQQSLVWLQCNFRFLSLRALGVGYFSYWSLTERHESSANPAIPHAILCIRAKPVKDWSWPWVPSPFHLSSSFELEPMWWCLWPNEYTYILCLETSRQRKKLGCSAISSLTWFCIHSDRCAYRVPQALMHLQI